MTTKKRRSGKVNKTKKKQKKSVISHSSRPKKVGGRYYFKDYPEFKPNLSPREMFKLGSFGGTYWRPIKSKVVKKDLKNLHKKYPKSWWKGIPENHLTLPFDKYDKTINKYGVKVGTTLGFWEGKGWIKKHHPYGWGTLVL